MFTESLRLPEHERAAHLDRAFGGDTDLRYAVETLIQEYNLVGEFLEKSP